MSEAAADEGITRRPTIALSLASGVAVVVALFAIAVGSTAALGVGAGGVVLVAVGLARSQPTALDVGAVALFAGVVVGGLERAAIASTVVGTIATVIAWDLGHGAIDLGEQLGREARTRRLEGVHVVSSLLIGLLSGTVGYAVYVVAGGGQPVAAVALLLLAAVLLTVGLGSDRSRGTRSRRGRR